MAHPYEDIGSFSKGSLLSRGPYRCRLCAVDNAVGYAPKLPTCRSELLGARLVKRLVGMPYAKSMMKLDDYAHQPHGIYKGHRVHWNPGENHHGMSKVRIIGL